MKDVANMLLRRLRVLIDRTLLTRVSYRGAVRVLQLQSREGVVHEAEHLEPYGFTSHPLPGAEGVSANLGGNRSRAIVIVVNDRRHRMVVEEGETAIYTHNGDFIHITSDGEIHVRAASRVLLETPLAELSQDLLVRGDVLVDGDVMAGDISLRGHRHQEHDGPYTIGGAV